MNRTQTYTDGIKYYNQRSYAKAAAQFSLLAASGDLFGRLGRLMLARCYWRNAWASWSQMKVAKAAENLSSAAVLAGPSMEMSRYFSRFYSKQTRPQGKKGDQKDKNVPAIDMLMDAYESINSKATKAEFQMVSGMSAFRKENWDQAREHFAIVSELEPNNPEPIRKIGLCYAEQGDFVSATAQLSKALDKEPGNLELTRELFSSAAAGGVKTFSTVSEPTSAGKADHGSLVTLAEVQIEQSDFVSKFMSLPASQLDSEIFCMVAGFMKCVLDRCGNYADMNFKASEVMWRLDDKAAAIEYARKAVEINPKYVLAHYRLGSMLMDIDPHLAARHLAMAVESGGDSLEVRKRLGQAVGNITENSDGADMPHKLKDIKKLTEIA